MPLLRVFAALYPHKGNIEANNGETLGQLAAAGVGVARVGAFSVVDDAAAGRLCQQPTPQTEESR